MGKLLMPGPFLGGLVLVGVGVVVFYIIPELPEAMTPEDTIANAELLGQIGGSVIGVGVFMMLFGLWRAFRR